MSLPSGARLGPYDIVAPLGAGGMGEVYRARDTRLGRDVALKVLPSGFSADPERLQRFEQEARAAAALNHPNILAVHDIGTYDAAPYIVSELLEGETLRERLAGGPLPVRKAIEYAVQVAHGLAAAHEKGIVHRDVKPENVFVTTDGHIKILDFGLAKLTEAEPALAGATALPTTPPNTIPGVVLGTIGYMSPEQVRGLAADHRSDIFALGAVLYEMVSGQRAFHGETAMDTMMAIAKEDPPDLPAADRHVPPALERIIDRCLEKNPAARFQSTRDLAFALEGLSARSNSAALAAMPARHSRERLGWMVAAAASAAFVVALALGATGYLARTSPAEAPEMRLQIATPRGSDPTSFAISPDGRKLVFHATTNGQSQLWLRPLGPGKAEPLAGTDGVLSNAQPQPFWSPDSQSIGFFTGPQLKRIDIASGVVRVLANAPLPRGGTWNADGTILFAPAGTGPLYRVSASGGPATEATHVEPPRQTGHRFPRFLPDGRHFLFFAVGTPENQGVFVGSLDSGDVRRVVETDSAATFAPPNFLLFGRQGILLGQRMDLDSLELRGEPLPVAARVAMRPPIAAVALSSSSSGPIAYRPDAGRRQLLWLDRSGQQIGTLGPSDADQSGQIRLSPDGRTVALRRTVSANTDVWMIDTGRGVLARLTSNPGSEGNPIWSPDGRRVAFTSDRDGSLDDLYEKSIDDSATETLLLATSEFKTSNDWSPDGRFILFVTQSEKTGSDLWVLPMFGDRRPSPVVQTAFLENNGRFSPDGRWVAYQSNESGRREVYVQPFPGTGGKSRVSTDGGTSPQRRGDGRELFYLSPDNVLMGVPVTVKGSTVEAGTPAALFSLSPGSEYAASPDGQRFLVNTLVEDPAPITVLLNWKAGIKK